MRTRREQVQAYRFVTRRIVSALLSGEPETNDLPMRRLGLAVFGSVMIATIVLAVVGVYGLLTNRSAELEDQTLVIERETGAKYVYINQKLFPVLNYASARLILNTATPEIRTMSQESLRGTPRGQPVGIPNAPDALPDPKALLKSPWRVCSSLPTDRPSEPITHVVLGRSLPGGTDLADRGLLVSADDQLYLLWDGRRLQVSGQTALAALELTGMPPLQVDRRFLEAVPAGPDLETIHVPGEGEPGHAIGGKPALVGEVFLAAGQYYVLTRQGLVAIGEVSARLRLAGGGSPREITPQQAGSALVRTTIEPEGFPLKVPQMVSAPPAVCTTHTPGQAAIAITTFATAPAALDTGNREAVQAQQTARDHVPVADRILVGGGQGALVQASSTSEPNVPGTTVYLVTDRGLKYPLGAGAQDALGYAGITPVGITSSVLALVPTGPTLDSASALRIVGSSGPAVTPSGSPSGSPSTNG